MLIFRKQYKIETYFQWKTNRKSYVAYRMAPVLVTLNDLEGHSLRSFPVCRPFQVQSIEHLCSIFPDFNWQHARAVLQRQLGFLCVLVAARGVHLLLLVRFLLSLLPGMPSICHHNVLMHCSKSVADTEVVKMGSDTAASVATENLNSINQSVTFTTSRYMRKQDPNAVNSRDAPTSV